MAITALPTPVPTRTDAANFNARAEEFLSALPTFATEANILATDLTNKQNIASTAATTASAAATTAVSAKDTAVTARNDASTYSNNAWNYYLYARDWAEKMDGQTAAGSYSSKYWAKIAQGFVVGTLIDNITLNNAKTFSNQHVYDNYFRLNGTSTITGQLVSSKSGPDPALSTGYSIKTTGSFGGGWLMVDGANQISMYSTSGQLNFGFGTEGNISSKFVIYQDGGWFSNASGTVQGILYVNNEIKGTSNIKIRNAGQADTMFYNENGTWGLYSAGAGDRLVHYDRTTGKRYFANISESDIWRFSAGGISKYPSGYCVLPNGLIIQWARLTTQGDFTFPIAFPTACFGVTTSVSSDTWDASNFVCFTNNITRFGFSFATGGIDYLGASYIAIGV